MIGRLAIASLLLCGAAAPASIAAAGPPEHASPVSTERVIVVLADGVDWHTPPTARLQGRPPRSAA
jgi:hypothetical protein